MSRIAALLALGLFWMAITGSASPGNVLLAMLVAMASIALVRSTKGQWLRRPRPILLAMLGLVFLKEIVASSWRVAKLVLRPTLAVNPVIFAYPLSVKSDFEIMLLANLITLTPGTLSVDVSADRSTLYIHAIDNTDDEQAIADIERAFERRIREAFG